MVGNSLDGYIKLIMLYVIPKLLFLNDFKWVCSLNGGFYVAFSDEEDAGHTLPLVSCVFSVNRFGYQVCELSW